jgi:hypothetical protein
MREVGLWFAIGWALGVKGLRAGIDWILSAIDLLGLWSV